MSDPFPAYFAELERRHLRDLSFAEVRRALQALSSLYVERRARIGQGAAFDGAGKRAAFALYYAPLHLLAVREIVRKLGATRIRPPLLVDLGCGTGAAGAGWALAVERAPEICGVERNGWAAAEARFALGALRLRGRIVRGELDRFRLPERAGAVVAAYTLNELEAPVRERLRAHLMEAARRGVSVLVVEPLARRVAPFWDDWVAAFESLGARADEWRLRLELPETLERLDKASGLDKSELGARSLFVPRASGA